MILFVSEYGRLVRQKEVFEKESESSDMEQMKSETLLALSSLKQDSWRRSHCRIVRSGL